MRKKHVGDVGEHWVLYRLVRHGYTAVLAPTNARSVDILASDEHGRPVSIQVKTKANAVGWRLTESAERVADDRLFYCLVDLGRSGDMEPPEVYVVPSAVVAKTVREGHARWLRGTKRSGEPRKDSAIRQIVREPWLEDYRENWSLITGAPALPIEVLPSHTRVNAISSKSGRGERRKRVAEQEPGAAQKAKGLAKEAAGTVMGDEEMKAEGRAEREGSGGPAEREGTEGHKEYFRKIIEETNKRSSGKA